MHRECERKLRFEIFAGPPLRPPFDPFLTGGYNFVLA
jgi:hypothetical protein